MLLRGYANGIFPMADSRDSDTLHWIDPQFRGIFPLDRFHVSRSLRRRIRGGAFDIHFDRDFAAVVQACADREETWINATIFDLYCALHAGGAAHCVGVYEGETLVGGVYGVVIGAAFFGESMFSRRTDASKVALTYLVDRLRMGEFVLFDTQFLTPHLASLGAIEIPRARYHRLLADAIARKADFSLAGPAAPPADQVLQRMTQTS
ncbi:leucyl/phenylalanyl-tRNA--protein transferase [Oceaniglobus trochenteri]|uniref:leucyl/phenylalanyl-tRNA--protein transferase n=1 Tax=Oceaniglobus trochenteri TaxID=2763260 RepID=UPI001CFFEFA4|nr:leucyl/phenylalanyl-tRNA--protein transferase [Oceaniglobus trochenteri]